MQRGPKKKKSSYILKTLTNRIGYTKSKSQKKKKTAANIKKGNLNQRKARSQTKKRTPMEIGKYRGKTKVPQKRLQPYYIFHQENKKEERSVKPNSEILHMHGDSYRKTSVNGPKIRSQSGKNKHSKSTKLLTLKTQLLENLC